MMTRFAHLLLLLAAGTAATAGCADEGATPSPSVARLPVILDYSPTISDANALLYLASNPAVELLAVTLAGTGESDCEPGVRATRSLLTIAGRPDVPVGCGRVTPLVGDRDWPAEWTDASNSLAKRLLPTVAGEPMLDAETLLAETISAARTPVTVIAVAPLTNLGSVFTAHKELASRLRRIVIMGGAVTVPGNVEASPAAEWNIYIDPEAARRVLAAGIPVTMVPLDATNSLPWSERVLRRLALLDAPAAKAVRQLVASRPSLEGIYLWDELAAMAALAPQLVTTQSMNVRIDDSGAVTVDSAGVTVDVAVRAESATAVDEFLRTINGGSLPEVVPLTPNELGYLVAMGGIDSRSNAAIGRAYAKVDPHAADQKAVAVELATAFFDAIDGLLTELRAAEPPASLSDAHGDYVEAVSKFAAQRQALLTALADGGGRDIEAILSAAMAGVDGDGLLLRVRQSCQVLEDFSFSHDGPRPCSSAAGS